ncbi:MAG: sugar transferase [Chloroflexota bacterium]
MQQTHILEKSPEVITSTPESPATLTPTRRRLFYPAVKRALDVMIATIAIILISPVGLIIAAVIKLDSRGPVLFKQTRLGLGGRPFTFYKFRTMICNADSKLHSEYVQSLIRNELPENKDGKIPAEGYKLVRDPRITRVGSVLRKTSLDEIPQLINVIKGEMSLVGPRPPLPYEVEVYQDWHKQRLDAIPGLTGWWQVMGRSQVSFDEMVRMDLEYISSCSLMLDLKIMLLTIPAVITGSGAR